MPDLTQQLAEGPLLAATRDASWFDQPNVRDPKRYHVAPDTKWWAAACNRWLPLAIESAVPATDVDPDLRCQRPACRRLWPVAASFRDSPHRHQQHDV